jgi:hypothetical protein
MEWKDITGYVTKNKIYQASINGQIRSVDKLSKKNTVLSQYKTGGYLKVQIFNTSVRVHKLVVLSNHEQPLIDSNFTIDHKDNNTENNHIDNLELVTRKQQNMNRRSNSRINIDSMPVVAIHIQTGQILKFHSLSQAETSLCGVYHTHISKCLSGKLKKHGGYYWSPLLSDEDLEDEIWVNINKTRNYIVKISNRGRIGFEYNCGYIKKISSREKVTSRYIEEYDGYPRIMINRRSFQLHILVWKTFRGEIPIGMVVNHKDHDKRNARLDNLELTTQSYNAIAAHDFGCYNGMKSERKSIKIDKNIYSSIHEASKSLNIPISTICYRLKNIKCENYVFLT